MPFFFIQLYDYRLTVYKWNQIRWFLADHSISTYKFMMSGFCAIKLLSETQGRKERKKKIENLLYCYAFSFFSWIMARSHLLILLKVNKIKNYVTSNSTFLYCRLFATALWECQIKQQFHHVIIGYILNFLVNVHELSN